jgi:DNA-directed RNA polymerase subunit D
LKVKVLEQEGNKLRFLVSETDNSMINSLRRAIMTEVPTMAIEDIFYFDNSSLVPDEVLALRVGMIPLTTDLENYVLPEDCDCEEELGCPKCTAILTLDVEATEEARTVYSRDLIPGDPEIRPASDNIPLSKLTPGQAIRFEAYAQLGRGVEHTKWSPVSEAIYQNTVLLDVEGEEAQKCAEACPRGALLTEEGRLKILNTQAFRACQECRTHYPENHEEFRRMMAGDEFAFSIEGHGSLPPMKIVEEAVKVLTAKLQDMEEKLEKGEIHEEIIPFEQEEAAGGRLYTIGSGEYEEEEEGGEGEGEEAPLYGEEEEI